MATRTRVSAGVAAAMLLGTLGAPAAHADEGNGPPVAVPDTVELVSGAEVRLDPRVNDTDPDGDALALVSAQVTSGTGSVALEGAGDTQVLLLSADPDFTGALVVTYVIADPAGAQAESTVTAQVTAAEPKPEPTPKPKPKPVNHRPVAVKDRLTVRAGSGKHKVRVLANDRDRDGDRIRLDKVKKAKRGKATKVGAKVVYRAPKKWSGTTKVRYRIRDAGGKTDWGFVKVKVKPRPKPKAPSRKQVESALRKLGLPTGWVNGTYDQATRRAVCAWRTVDGRTAHRGLPTRGEARAIVATSRLPKARGWMVSGVNISVTCQAAFWVSKKDNYRRIMAASTGKAGYRTRLGTWRVFITHRTWRYSTIYPDARMYKPMQFSGGQAMHGSATDALVKTYPASHGCVRMLHRDIDAMQAGGVGNGTLVKVVGHWRG